MHADNVVRQGRLTESARIAPIAFTLGWTGAKRLAAAVALGVLLAACSHGTPVSPSGIPTSTAPGAPAAAGSVWVANEGGDSLTVLNSATNTVAATLTGIKYPHNVQVSRDAATVYAVSNSANLVIAIDPTTLKVAAVAATGPALSVAATVPVGTEPAGISYSPRPPASTGAQTTQLDIPTPTPAG